MVKVSGLLRSYRSGRSGMWDDFRGSRWGMSDTQILMNEVENLREGWCGTGELLEVRCDVSLHLRSSWFARRQL